MTSQDAYTSQNPYFTQASKAANEKLAINADSKGTDQNLVDKKLAVIRQALRGESVPMNYTTFENK